MANGGIKDKFQYAKAGLVIEVIKPSRMQEFAVQKNALSRNRITIRTLYFYF